MNWCYYINPCQDPELFGGYVPSRVDRDEPGHAPMIGKDDQAPWVWGKTLEEAEATCEAVNAKMGIDSKEGIPHCGQQHVQKGGSMSLTSLVSTDPNVSGALRKLLKPEDAAYIKARAEATIWQQKLRVDIEYLADYARRLRASEKYHANMAKEFGEAAQKVEAAASLVPQRIREEKV